MGKVLIKDVNIVNEGKIFLSDILVVNDRIEKIAQSIKIPAGKVTLIVAEGFYLIPGLIDDQVHFREPGLTHKATIGSETRAAAAGGITSFMDMPNTSPNATSLKILEEKYALASKNSLVNYSFFMGINKHNLDEALKIDNSMVCGLSDDGLYFDDEEGILANYPEYLNELFSKTNSLVALHCEDDSIINHNLKAFKIKYGNNIPVSCHPLIRDEKACLVATKRVISIAEKHQTRLHILHVSTQAEAQLFKSEVPLRNKRITSEVCVHHLWFSDKDYQLLGNKIKWNPAIKSESNKTGLLKALIDNDIDIIATDHAPHLLSEKEGDYFQSKSGAPLVQHALPALLELFHEGKISLQKIVEKTSHHVAEIYRIKDRGYIREGYYADLVVVDMQTPYTVSFSLFSAYCWGKAAICHASIFYPCGWCID